MTDQSEAARLKGVVPDLAANISRLCNRDPDLIMQVTTVLYVWIARRFGLTDAEATALILKGWRANEAWIKEEEAQNAGAENDGENGAGTETATGDTETADSAD